MSDDEQNSEDMKSFGFDDSGADFSIGCFGSGGEKLPMEELDEWEEEEVNPIYNYNTSLAHISFDQFRQFSHWNLSLLIDQELSEALTKTHC